MDENTPVAPNATEIGTQSQEGVATSETATDSPTTAVETEEKLYAGKYKSPEELEKAYIESQSKMTQIAQEKANLERMSQQVPDEANAEANPELDPTVVPALQNLFKNEYAQLREIERAQEFERKFADDLKNPLVRDRTQGIIREANTKGERVDQEIALNQAKKELEQLSTPQVKEAKEEGFKEGHELAKAKTQAGAVGSSRDKGTIDPSKLSAKEFAEYYNLPRA